MACLATLALWVRSTQTEDTLLANWAHLPDRARIVSGRGRLRLDTPQAHWEHDTLDGGVWYKTWLLGPDDGTMPKYQGPNGACPEGQFFWGEDQPRHGMMA